MQRDLAADTTALEVHILGINGAGYEAGNAEICANRTLPWLQDTSHDDVWARWAVTYRDVVVLDGKNCPVAVFNLTEHDLGVRANYDSLKSLLLEAAGPK